MKTNFLKRAINVCMLVCAVCVLTSGNVLKSQTFTGEYYYDCIRDADFNEPTQTICKLDESGKYLVPHLKYFFTYDNEGRVIKKEAQRWDNKSKSWKESYEMNVEYEENYITLNYAVWDNKEETYSLKKERAIYTMRDNELISYACYKQGSGEKQWLLIATIHEMQMDPLFILKNYLLAETKLIN